jgi:hypothetical protein
LEFIAKKKTLRVTVGGATHEMVAPTIGQTEALSQVLNEAQPQDAFKLYAKFFTELGLPDGVIQQFDQDDFFDFIGFVLHPKKKASPPTT